MFPAEAQGFRVMTDGSLWVVRWSKPVELRNFMRPEALEEAPCAGGAISKTLTTKGIM